MEKDWEDFLEGLTSEIKREIVENYFSEKLYLEEEWKTYESLLEILKKFKKEFSIMLGGYILYLIRMKI
jgi:hypothetical protein